MKILVTGAWNCTKEDLNELRNFGHEIFFLQQERDALPCSYDEVQGVICNGLFLYHPIQKFSSLKFIQLTSAGFDRVDMDYIRNKGIQAFNARGVYSIPMAEFALFGVLQLYKNAKFFMENQRRRKWEKHRGNLELFGKTVCIIGAGNVGTECAKRFGAFGTQVLGVDLFPRTDEHFNVIYPLSDLNKGLSSADIVVLTLPLTAETENMMNEQSFALMKKGSVLVNIARGAIVEERALVKALDERLLGAVLDVFGQEPLSDSNPLWEKENVIITPHNSFVGDGNAQRLKKVIKENLKNYGF